MRRGCMGLMASMGEQGAGKGGEARKKTQKAYSKAYA